MIPKELIKKIHRIEITTNRIVNNVMGGQYLSAFKGRGMEFSEVREYIPGDDIRSIDWNVTARYHKPYIKRYVEERELTVLFLMDISGSTAFGSSHQLKNELSAEICAVLAFSAIKNNDQVGSVLFTEKIESYVPPKKGSNHVLRVIRDILFFKPQGRGTNISLALEYLNHIQRRRAVVFVVSDFMDSGFQKVMRITSQHHDLVTILIEDPREREIPKMRWLSLEDAESGQMVCVDLWKESVRQQFRQQAEDRLQAHLRFFASAGIDCLRIRADQPYENGLYAFLRKRAQRMR